MSDDKLSYRIDEAVTATGLSRSTLYRYITKGELHPFKVGDCTLIARSDLEAFLKRAQGAQAA
jgi:excisionase family DNA binding protein